MSHWQRTKLWLCTLTFLSAAYQFLQLFGIPSALYSDLRGGDVQFAEIIWRKLDVNGAEVFFQPMQLSRARNRHDPRFLCKQPSQCDLRRCRFLLLGEPANQINHRLIRFSILFAKARDNVAEIAFVELRIFADLAREEAFAQRAKRNESNPEFLERRDHLRFRFSPPYRIFALQRSDGLNFVCATDRLYPRFRKSEVLHLALLNQILHGSSDIFNRYVRINTVLIEQIDDIGLETLQRSLSDFLDVLWTAVQSGLFAGGGIQLEPELGGDHHFSTERTQGFAHEFFVGKRAVDFSRVEECDASLHSGADDRDHFLRVSGGAVAKAHSHAAEPKSRDLQVAFSKFSCLHCLS